MLSLSRLGRWRITVSCFAVWIAWSSSIIAAPPQKNVLVLEDATRQKCLTILRSGLRSAEFWPSIHAAEGLTLGGHGDEVITFLKPMLDEPFDDQQRCGISRELVRAGYREAAANMLDILAGEKDFGHIHAAESLYKVGELGDGIAMRRAFDQQKNTRLRLMAAAALGKAGNPDALTYLRDMLLDQDPELARTAAWILARIGGQKDIEAIQRGMQQVKDELSRAYFEHALAALGDVDGAKALAKNLNSKNPGVKVFAATFAGDAGLVDVAPRLIELLDDETLDVRIRAAQSLLVLARPANSSSDLSVLPNAKSSVYDALLTEAGKSFQKRREEFEKIKTPEDCETWQKRQREFFLKQLGGLPEKTPLNAQVAGELDGGDYRIEKIIYESRPSHHVTATLYLPKSKPPYPAVLIACGHTKSGKAADYNQKIGILLAKNGIAAMCYDPIGQGERSQVLTEDGHPEHKGSTTEHFLAGIGAILTGTNTAQYRIWDGIRGIDYLCERSDINPQKIGCTGCSGGGTLTSYIMALDDRVTCAAPACYLTTFEKLLETIGPQDAEQNIHAQVAFGMEQTDYVLMRAPKPTLICATTDDFFNIDGTWDTFRQSKRIYGLMGQPEQVNLVETAGKHGVTQTGREAIVRWMQRWLLGVDKDVSDPGAKVWSAEDLQCTPKGQVLLLEGEKSVFDLNGERADRFEKQRQDFRDLEPDARRKIVRSVAGIHAWDKLPKAKLRTVGMPTNNGYQIRKLVMDVAGGISIPILRITPQKPSGERTLYLSDEGIRDCLENPEIKKSLEAGHEVWAMELRGNGELRHPSSSQQLGDWKTASMAYLLGQSLIGQRVDDVLNCIRLMNGLAGQKPKPVHLLANGTARNTLMFVAAVEPSLFASRSLGGKFEGWSRVCRNPEPNFPLSETVHGVLMYFELSDLFNLWKKN